ncbi:helix-turn-helix domain-containing protein [Vibrio parahaemolyticus]|uniref:helix-turn-helix domain-containing protein n=1 Tax=Vibrio parahaemolyticus TaxID=670 RepID=UPI00226A9122|nr:helix-turn-helix domain-containing protein [Vibrio parahaemolyticus]EHK0752622.1 helix-turn-helix transcriptional regulator [Vibrio parahaemolyticus]MCX8932113.1 helix-turn-helix domain-containing protein [Vibrio parahaemolyticus]
MNENENDRERARKMLAAMCDLSDGLVDVTGDTRHDIPFSKHLSEKIAASVGGKVKLFRERALFTPKPLTQKELATKAGVDQAIISRIEKGNVKAMDHLGKVARALGLTTSWLITGEGEPLKNGIYSTIHKLTLIMDALEEVEDKDPASSENNYFMVGHYLDQALKALKEDVLDLQDTEND